VSEEFLDVKDLGQDRTEVGERVGPFGPQPWGEGRDHEIALDPGLRFSG
jgi:hypothetical protein